MSYDIETITSGDWRVIIRQDEDCESPREYTQLGTMITWDRHYLSPDKNEFAHPEDFDDFWFGWELDDEGERVMSDDCPANDPAYIRLPVYKYEHGGVAYSTGGFGDPWDSGQVGWIFTTPTKIEETGAPEDSWTEQLRAEVEEYSKWANGACYAYTVEHLVETCDKCHSAEWGLVESCGGFIGKCYVELPAEAPEELRAKLAESYYVEGV